MEIKKILAIILVLVLCLGVFAGCKDNLSEDGSSMFVKVEEVNEWIVVYHRETKVMYVVSDGSYNRGIFTLLVNADGTPMLWEDQ